MGNCYHGKLRFFVPNTTPKEILDKYISYTNSEKNPYFGREYFNVYWTRFSEYWGYFLEEIKMPYKNYKCRKMYCIELLINGKGYIESEVDEVIEDLRLYVLKDEYDPGTLLGEIHDEDTGYKKYFYLDLEDLKAEQIQRSNICNSDCKEYNSKKLCDNYELCRRCHNIGYTEGRRILCDIYDLAIEHEEK